MTLPIAVFKTVFSRRGLVSFGIFALLAGFILSYAWASRQGLLSASSEQATPYSELYAARPSDIPAQSPAGSHLTLPFTITNHEDSAMTYHYEVLVQDGTTTRSLSDGRIMLLEGAESTVSSQIDLPSTPGSYTILIELMDQKQIIQFHIKGV